MNRYDFTAIIGVEAKSVEEARRIVQREFSAAKTGFKDQRRIRISIAEEPDGMETPDGSFESPQ